MKHVYAMLQAVFNESFIFPVLGPDDTYPNGFFPFADRRTLEHWLPETPKKLQYLDQSVKVTEAIFKDWQLYYPYSWLLQHYPIENPVFDPVNEAITLGFYKV